MCFPGDVILLFKSNFEDKLNVCRQTGAGMQFHFIAVDRVDRIYKSCANCWVVV